MHGISIQYCNTAFTGNINTDNTWFVCLLVCFYSGKNKIIEHGGKSYYYYQNMGNVDKLYEKQQKFQVSFIICIRLTDPNVPCAYLLIDKENILTDQPYILHLLGLWPSNQDAVA